MQTSSHIFMQLYCDVTLVGISSAYTFNFNRHLTSIKNVVLLLCCLDLLGLQTLITSIHHMSSTLAKIFLMVTEQQMMIAKMCL